MFFSSAHKPQLLFYFLLLDLEPDFPSGERLHDFSLVPKSEQRNEARVSVVNDKRMKRSTWTFPDSVRRLFAAQKMPATAHVGIYGFVDPREFADLIDVGVGAWHCRQPIPSVRDGQQWLLF